MAEDIAYVNLVWEAETSVEIWPEKIYSRQK